MKQTWILAFMAAALLASPITAYAGGGGAGPQIPPCPENQNCGYDPTYDPIHATNPGF